MKSLSPEHLKLCIIFGGPSTERDISLDSARTFFDGVRFWLSEENITLIFVDKAKRFFELDHNWIYSNKIEDFESLLGQTERGVPALTDQDMRRIMTITDVVVPLLHGEFGEDGALIEVLRSDYGVTSIVGSGGEVLRTLFDKALCYQAMADHGVTTPDFKVIAPTDTAGLTKIAESWGADGASFIVKPARGGSSDGVSLATADTAAAAVKAAAAYDDKILIERYIDGREFSIIVIQDHDDTVVPLVPTEVSSVQSDDHFIYSRVKKYMPGAGARHDTPARLPEDMINRIRTEAEGLFERLGATDWARFDGFVTDSGDIIWADLNGVPGFGIDSFFFQQCALFDLGHSGVCKLLVERALNRGGQSLDFAAVQGTEARAPFKVAVLGGGVSSERHVSRMSWLNVIQKLSMLDHYRILPVFMDAHGAYWQVPYFVTLQHTVEEIEEIIADPARYIAGRDYAARASQNTTPFWQGLRTSDPVLQPNKTDLNTLAGQIDFAFIALHGGEGENGSLQQKLDDLGVPYNGSPAAVSQITMQKDKTADALNTMGINGFRGPRQVVVQLIDLFSKLKAAEGFEDAVAYIDNPGARSDLDWSKIQLSLYAAIADDIAAWKTALGSQRGLVLKPLGDGCSSGVLVAKGSCIEIGVYLALAYAGTETMPWNLLGGNFDGVSDEFRLRMPPVKMEDILVEELLDSSQDATRPIEITIAVVGRQGKMTAMLPSETVSEFGILTVEEKFCKGGGINLTPPPELNADQIATIQQKTAEFANRIGLDGYSRIDAMFFPDQNELVLIEINSLPGLSPATVTFTQALLTPGVRKRPSEFLHELVILKT